MDTIKTADQSRTCYSRRYAQTYHSRFGARSEAAHVFLQGSGVEQRLASHQPVRVLEVGFGLGLNCLVTADCAAVNHTPLHYVALEHDPVDAATFRALDYQAWLQTPKNVESVATCLEQIAPDETIQVPMNAGEACLQLRHVDASKLDRLCPGSFDAIYLDAFSPDVNPECWTGAFFSFLHNALAARGRIATYCVKGTVRRQLANSGFNVHKRAGPAGKREVLVAIRA